MVGGGRTLHYSVCVDLSLFQWLDIPHPWASLWRQNE
jgi:hypothetical protein